MQSTRHRGSGVRLFVADDDEDDRTLLEEAFSEINPDLRLEFAIDGADLVEQLSGVSAGDKLVVVTDLMMPGIGGFDTIRNLRGNPRYRSVPIIVLSTSNAERDVDLSYDLGANSVFSKPSTFQELLDIAQIIHNYWLDIAQVPKIPNVDPR